MTNRTSNTALALNPTADMWSNPEKLKEIRAMVCATPLTDLEFSFLVELGRATQLNPFMREIWAVKYKQGVAASIFIGRDGYRKGAQRQPDYEFHQVNAVYSQDEFKISYDEVQHNYGFSNRGDLVGAYCLVKRKSSSKYTYVMVTMNEYDLNQGLWKSKPETMIKKVAEAQALRQAFQEVFAGTYSDAELPEEKTKLTLIKAIPATNGTQTEKLTSILTEQVVDIDTGEILNPKTHIVAGDNNLPISEEQIDEIECLMHEKMLSEERKQKAYEFYKIENLTQLTDAQARKFIFQLEKL